MRMNKYRILIKDIIIFGVGALGSKVLLFLLLPLYTNVLSDAEYGIADLVFTIGQLILPFVSLAVFNGLIRFGLMKDNRKEDVWLSCSIVFFLGSLTTIVCTPLLVLYGAISEWKWYLCCYIISQFAFTNTLTYLKVKDKNKQYTLFSLLQTLLLVGFNILFLIVLKWGIKGYLLSMILSMSIIALTAFLYGSMYKDIVQARFNKQLTKAMISYSIPFILNDLSWWLIHSSDKIMIEGMISVGMLGIYTAAAKIPSLLNVFSSVFSSAWGLSSIREYDNSNDEGFYSSVFRYLSSVMFGACIVIIIILKPFMKVYVGKEFYDAWHYVPLLLVSAVFGSFSAFSSSMLGAMKDSKKIMTTTLIAGVGNVILNYIFIKICGVWGAVIGTVASYILVSILRMVEVHKRINIQYGYVRLLILSIIVINDAVLVGLDIHPITVSIASFILFLLVIYKDLFDLICNF